MVTEQATAVKPSNAEASTRLPTVWGLDPVQLHARYWASRGVQVVRLGEPSEIVDHAELYLLTDRTTLVQFDLKPVVEQLNWLDVDLFVVRLADARERGYREQVVTDADGRFTRFERLYGGSDSRLARVALTPVREVALAWQMAASSREGWHRLRHGVKRSSRWTIALPGRVYDRESRGDLAHFARDLVRDWSSPESTIHHVNSVGRQVWAMDDGSVSPEAKVTGSVWVGAGRRLKAGESAVGPAVMWDDPAARPVPDDVRWLDLEPTAAPTRAEVRTSGRGYLVAKRIFDIAFSLAAIGGSLILWPLIALAIIVEDGRPVFFAHRRETIGGRTFPCLKFRSMRRDAEKIKQQFQAQNKADGPQFFIENDPRLTKVGTFLRKYQIDEWPQFLNVLKGDMSVVGPRPSPFKENQYCPPWREARLSVKPGVTGLWQVMRTRRPGADFQEWIKYDIEYVERASFVFDMKIIWWTVMQLVRGVLRS